MADKKISALTGATTPVAGTEVLPIVQSGSTVKVSIDNLTAGRAVSTGTLTVVGTINGSNYQNLGTQASTGAGAAISFVPSSSLTNWLVGSNYTLPGLFEITPSTAGGGTTFTTPAVTVASTGDTTLKTGNLIQGTAAKGVNFTANTPAAGMTSQLLNWYEEGTWTPAITSAGGSITSTGNASGNYTRIGNQVTAWFTIKITDNGTGSSYIKLTGIPFNLASAGKTVATGVENGVSSKQLVIYGNSATELIVTFYDGTYPGATNAVFVGCITYYV